MKKTIVLLMTLCCFSQAHSQSQAERQVGQAVEALRVAMVDPDKASLERLTSGQLSYGHSSGAVDSQQQFIRKLADGRSDFVAITLKNQQISISKDVAVVRHELHANTMDGGKPGEVHLFVLLVWQKEGRQWKLLARQAVKMM